MVDIILVVLFCLHFFCDWLELTELRSRCTELEKEISRMYTNDEVRSICREVYNR